MRREIVQGDAFERLTELPADSAHAAIVDYPWKFSCQNGSGRMEYRNKPSGIAGKASRDIDDDDAMYRMENHERVPELLAELRRILVDGAWALFLADDDFQEDARDALRESEFIFRRNWVWSPLRPGLGYYGRVNHYPIPAATNGETQRYVSRGTLYLIEGGRQTEFTTGKPVQLYRELLETPVIQPGERLIEPFCGSAPGYAVAIERDLGYWGCDIDPEAVEVARDRGTQGRLGASVLTDGGLTQDADRRSGGDA